MNSAPYLRGGVFSFSRKEKKMKVKTAKTIKPYNAVFKDYVFVVPKGSQVTNLTANGPDDSYHFWDDYKDYVRKLTGTEYSLLAHDLKHYGLNIPAEFCEPYKEK